MSSDAGSFDSESKPSPVRDIYVRPANRVDLTPGKCIRSPTIHFINTAEAAHSGNYGDNDMLDPELTHHGWAQCRTLRGKFKHHQNVAHVLASPLCRAVQTALYAFEPEKRDGGDEPYIHLLPVLQELTDWPCHHGMPVAALKASFGPEIDYRLVRPGWDKKDPPGNFNNCAADRARWKARGANARRQVRATARGAGENSHVVVVTHASVLEFITGPYEEGRRQDGWPPCEMKSFQFADLWGADDEAALNQWDGVAENETFDLEDVGEKLWSPFPWERGSGSSGGGDRSGSGDVGGSSNSAGEESEGLDGSPIRLPNVAKMDPLGSVRGTQRMAGQEDESLLGSSPRFRRPVARDIIGTGGNKRSLEDDKEEEVEKAREVDNDNRSDPSWKPIYKPPPKRRKLRRS